LHRHIFNSSLQEISLFSISPRSLALHAFTRPASAPRPLQTLLFPATTDEAFSSAAQQLRGLIDVLPELPDEVQGALAMRVPGLLDLEPQEVRARLQTLASTLGLEFELTARLIGKVRVWVKAAQWGKQRVGASSEVSQTAQ
jgi:hypothetical protein